MSSIEIERTPGFSNAEGNEGISYASANQAFYAYLEATGQKRTSENKAKFKEWLAKAKESGKLEKVIKTKKEPMAEVVETVVAEEVQHNNADGDNSGSAMKPNANFKKVMIVVGVIAATWLLAYGIHKLANRKSSAA